MQLKKKKLKLEKKLKKPKKNDDAEDSEDEFAVPPPYVKKEVSEHQQVKEELRQGV